MRSGYIVDHTCGRRFIGHIFEDGDETGRLEWAVMYRLTRSGPTEWVPWLLHEADSGADPVDREHADCELTVEAAL